jgi:hypothetical protein
MADYGCKGGTSATAGKQAEVLRSPSTGLTKRVFKGQRWLVVSQKDEAARCTICAFTTIDRAKRCSDNAHKLGFEVHYVERAEVLA